MNAQSIIQSLTLERTEKATLLYLAQQFDQNTPASLYLDYYELAHGTTNFPGVDNTTPEQWEQFLDIPEIYRYRHQKIAKLQEFAAIKAIKSLEAQGQTASASAVTALKEITKLSKQLSSTNNNRQKIILTYVPPKEAANVQQG